MEAAGAGAEVDVAALRVVFERRAAVPQAAAAVHAFLAIERRPSIAPSVIAWPEHISMHSLAAQRAQKSG